MKHCGHKEGRYHNCDYVDQRNKLISEILKELGIQEWSETHGRATLDPWHFRMIQERVEREIYGQINK